jgi:charged multivesicular body protein 4A/B
MSFFKKLFGGGKKKDDISAITSIQKLEETESLLKKKQEFIETKIKEELEVAQLNAKTNKRSE